MSFFCDNSRSFDKKKQNDNIESKTKGMDQLVDLYNPQKDDSYTSKTDDKILLQVYKLKFGGLEKLIKKRNTEI